MNDYSGGVVNRHPSNPDVDERSNEMRVVFVTGGGGEIEAVGESPIPVKGEHIWRGGTEYFVLRVVHEYVTHTDGENWIHRLTSVYIEEIKHG